MMSLLKYFKYTFDAHLYSPERTIQHGELLAQKTFMRKLYRKWYRIFISESESLPLGKMIEIGSGGSFLKSLKPEILRTDILDLKSNDITMSAFDMPFEDGSVSAFFMTNTLHVFPDVKGFFSEVSRCLTKGGRLIMIEPAITRWSKIIYQMHYLPLETDLDWSSITEPLKKRGGTYLLVI